MSKKTNKKTKHNNQISRAERNEHLTNWYMINLTLGVAGILALLLVRSCYRNMSILSYIQPAMWILTAIFAVCSIAIFMLGKCKIIKNTKRATNYSIFLGICTLFALWLALYNIIRPIIEDAARAILNNSALTIGSYWNIRIPIILICAYLVISFIVYLIKLAKK